MSRRPTIAPVLVPHGFCLPGCPYCPSRQDLNPSPEQLLPDADSVAAAVERRRTQQLGRGQEPTPVEIGFYGGDLWALPRGPRTALLDAAEREVRRGRAAGIRLTMAPVSVLRAPLSEFRARGVRAVEVVAHSLDKRVLTGLGARQRARAAVDAVGRLHQSRIRSIVTLTPGLPGSSHGSALHSAETLGRSKPAAARILPALALSGTRLGALYRSGRWRPMRLDQADVTCRHVLMRLRQAGVEVIRVGLQPRQDLLESPEVLAGPYDPGLRLRVESELMRLRATATLTSAFSLGTRAFTFVVNPREENFLRGPENRTVEQIRQQFRLDRLHIVALEQQPPGSLRAFAGHIASSDVPALPPRRARKAS